MISGRSVSTSTVLCHLSYSGLKEHRTQRIVRMIVQSTHYGMEAMIWIGKQTLRNSLCSYIVRDWSSLRWMQHTSWAREHHHSYPTPGTSKCLGEAAKVCDYCSQHQGAGGQASGSQHKWPGDIQRLASWRESGMGPCIGESKRHTTEDHMEEDSHLNHSHIREMGRQHSWLGVCRRLDSHSHGSSGVSATGNYSIKKSSKTPGRRLARDVRTETATKCIVTLAALGQNRVSWQNLQHQGHQMKEQKALWVPRMII